jgi:hypothetical protein
MLLRLLLSTLLAALANAAAAAEPLARYEGRVIVTGTGEETRTAGMADALVDVLVKVSGDPRLAKDSRVPELAEQANSFVTTYSYRDRMEGIPVHDEQGTRDRPHDLTVEFDAAKVNATLNALGRKPWTERPPLAAFLAVDNGSRTFVLHADEEIGRDLREALAAASDRYGVATVLPDQAALGGDGLSVQELSSASSEGLDALAKMVGGAVPLVGSLIWDDKQLGWVANWRFRRGHDAMHEWHIEGVSFDAALRSGVGGAAQILSGNGAPQR